MAKNKRAKDNRAKDNRARDKRQNWLGLALPSVFAIFLAALLGAVSLGFAQTQTPAPAAPPTPAPVITAPTTPAPDVSSPATGDTTPVLDSSPQNFAARPVIMLTGKSNWDDAYTNLRAAFAKLSNTLAKQGLSASQTGRPLAAFIETSDDDFTFEAMLPLTALPQEKDLAGKDPLPADMKFTQSPGGRAIKFQHRGPYDDIDTTYEAITAILDERGLDAQNMFVEEYLNDAPNAGDPGLQVDIYVFLK